ncbi:hypothetical protein G4B88_013296 [Cannabis sativa]|uniref:Uncharacterized protein n=1 Tax=Cannabis sativa TaxID=3483 RepID=A0A7J6DN19_CANSA|nr:hypothetical protein G4B88_013296 [Cannabis sativa]
MSWFYIGLEVGIALGFIGFYYPTRRTILVPMLRCEFLTGFIPVLLQHCYSIAAVSSIAFWLLVLIVQT